MIPVPTFSQSYNRYAYVYNNPLSYVDPTGYNPLKRIAKGIGGLVGGLFKVFMLLDKGLPAVKELSMAKAYSVQVGYRAVDRAMQTQGAMGFTNEVGLADAWHSLRIVNVADGTNEILYRTIVHRMLRGAVEV